MKILAIDTSAGPASCAVAEEGRLLASAFQNTRLTHSQTLLPMVESMLRGAALTLEEMDLLAVSAGPGSFTGLRIGMAAVKGMAFPGDKPCAAVSTLAAMARNLEGLPLEGLVCPVMDARCQQVYTALFECRDGVVTRQTPDEAISIEELKNRLISVKKSVIMVGDGANLCYNTLKGRHSQVGAAPPAVSAGGGGGGGSGPSSAGGPGDEGRGAAAGLSAAAPGGKRAAQAAVRAAA